MKIDWNNTKTWIIIIVIVVIVLMIAITFFKKLLKKDPNKNSEKEAKNTMDESNLTYDQEQYNLYADKIQGALDRLFKDIDIVYSVMTEMQNKDDIKALIVAFGQRKPKSYFVFGPASNLTEWIASALDTTEISKLNEKITQTGYKF